jgi:hypothetical protein
MTFGKRLGGAPVVLSKADKSASRGGAWLPNRRDILVGRGEGDKTQSGQQGGLSCWVDDPPYLAKVRTFPTKKAGGEEGRNTTPFSLNAKSALG